ncbi:hypothetical protein CDD82_5564 [Ophiocordyceps australis]|uniref:FRG1-like family protein n=1 Tax=Ophiocordyceps australis TaxID=1399860 RepID=A0A2C5XI60_9HYPO|nr:hypothetical protein CDD82_5564 [Ophiocordyceps australis]
MVKPLTFKGDKRAKKRKRDAALDHDGAASTSAQHLAKADASTVDADNDDSWVSADVVGDVVGPVMIVLPTDEPSALACDAIGSVFAMPIDNMVDGNAASAEPHDVRQVWVASRVAGTESFRFKGHHGRQVFYLASDQSGHLSATSEAVSPLETFTVLSTPNVPGTFQLQTHHDTFITATPPSGTSSKSSDVVRANADAIVFATTLRIRMQARFKPRIKATRREQALSRISRRELDEAAGRRLTEDEVKTLKRARREGDYHEKLLDIKVKGKHDKFA